MGFLGNLIKSQYFLSAFWKAASAFPYMRGAHAWRGMCFPQESVCGVEAGAIEKARFPVLL